MPFNVDANKTRKQSYRKDDRAMCLMYGCPENYRESLTTPMATFPQNFNELVFRLNLKMCLQGFNFVALPVPEIIWGTLNIGQPLDTPMLSLRATAL